jgi:FMN phosphatase YigB (HAD superfamily)
VTNSPEKYAVSVLKHLKLQNCFDKVISVEKMRGSTGLKPKPMVFQWQRLIRLAGVPATEITVVDDCLRNLKTAKFLGCETVWALCFKGNGHNSRIQALTPLFVDKKIKNLSGLFRV